MKVCIIFACLFFVTFSQQLNSSEILNSLTSIIDKALIKDDTVKAELRGDAESLAKEMFELLKKQMEDLNKNKSTITPANLLDQLKNPDNMLKYLSIAVKLQGFLDKIKKYNNNPDLKPEMFDNIGKNDDESLANFSDFASFANLMGGAGNLSELFKNLGQNQKSNAGYSLSDLEKLMNLFKGGGDSKDSKKEMLKQLGDSLKEIMRKQNDDGIKQTPTKQEEGIGIYIVGGVLAFILVVILLILIRRSFIQKKSLKYEELQPRPLSASIPIEESSH